MQEFELVMPTATDNGTQMERGVGMSVMFTHTIAQETARQARSEQRMRYVADDFSELARRQGLEKIVERMSWVDTY